MKYLTLLSSFFLTLFVYSSVFASPIIPQPVCEILAEVLEGSSTFQQSEKNIAITNIEVLDIVGVSSQGYAPESTCDTYQDMKINEATLFLDNPDNLKKGQKIKGEIQLVGDEYGTGHLVRNVRMLESVVGSESEEPEMEPEIVKEVVNDSDFETTKSGKNVILVTAVIIVVFVGTLLFLRRNKF